MKSLLNKKRNHITTGIACGISAFCLLFFFISVYCFGQVDSSVADATPEKGEITEQTGDASSLSFTSGIYEVEAYQAMDMSKYLQTEGLALSDVTWSTTQENEKITVGSNGNIVLEGYDIDCQLVATNKKDQTVSSTCVVRTRSEQEDFVYEIETLNGMHQSDETNEEGVTSLAFEKDEELKIDENAINYPVKKGKDSYQWDKSVFYRLEDVYQDSDKDGQIAYYLVEKKKFFSKNSGNAVDYEIYHHPKNNNIHKIVSIEHMEDDLEVTEYYYNNSGKVNFVYVYHSVNYTPNYAVPSQDGERFLYCKDALVTWRVIKNKKENNYCSSKKEARRLKHSSHNHVTMYDKCKNKIKGDFRKKEKLMLNRAYNTLKKVQDYDGISTISGYLNQADQSAVSDAKVTLKSEKYQCDAMKVNTDKDGYYEIFVPTTKHNYELNFQKDNYVEENLYQVEIDKDEVDATQEMVYLAAEDDNSYRFLLYFYDALNKAADGEGMEQLEEVSYWIRRGVNNRTGEVIVENAIDGYEDEVELSPGMYTIQYTQDGYLDSYSSLFVSDGTENELSVYATPKLSKGEYRVVLTWGSRPYDLDSHMFAPLSRGDSSEDYHICYYHQSSDSGEVSLDVDDTDGYGPETTTIKNISNGQYKYYVCDFTNCSDGNEKSYEMSNSSATVRVYGQKGLIQSFYVPANRQGVIWEVFEIRNHKVIPSERYYSVIGNKNWWHSNK